MPDDIDEFLLSLASEVGPARSEVDRYRDFRQVFLATDQGRRVLCDILGWGRMYRPLGALVAGRQTDPYEHFRREGERDMALKILATVRIEPPTDRPTRQQTTED